MFPQCSQPAIVNLIYMYRYEGLRTKFTTGTARYGAYGTVRTGTFERRKDTMYVLLSIDDVTLSSASASACVIPRAYKYCKCIFKMVSGLRLLRSSTFEFHLRTPNETRTDQKSTRGRQELAITFPTEDERTDDHTRSYQTTGRKVPSAMQAI